MLTEDDLDKPIWGATDIAVTANLFKKNKHGEWVPDVPRAYDLLETGAINARIVIRRRKRKDGTVKTPQRGQWVSTKRMILGSLGLLPPSDKAAA